MRLIGEDADKAIIDFNVLNKMIGDLQGDNFEPQDVLEAVLDYIDNAPKYTNAPTVQREGWVSVEDRLPNVGEWYLIFVKDKFATMAFLDTHTETGETLWLAHNNNFQDEWENVTHWMPLPAAPKE